MYLIACRRSFVKWILTSLLLFSGLYARQPGNEFILKLPGSSLRLSLVTPSIVRVTVSPAGTFSKRKSLSVLDVNEKFRLTSKELDNKIIVFTDKLSICISKTDGSIIFSTPGGKVLLNALAPDKDSFILTSVQNEKVYKIKQRFHLSGDEGLFGLGQFEDGVMNYRNRDVMIAQANRVAVNPFLVSSNGYGILWDNYSMTIFHDNTDGTYFSSEAADEISYYFAAGNNIDDAISGYRTLTGKAPMFGKWAYGYWQSKERYMNSDELIGIVKEYRRREVPLDNVIQDWQYWGEMDNFSGMSWDSLRYRNPKAMMDTLHKYNAHMIASIWPAFGAKSLIYKELDQNKLLFNEPHWSGGKVYDAYNPKARSIYWKHLKKAFFDNNVDGYWMDGSEPEFRCTDDRFITSREIEECGSNFLGSMARYLNTYSLMHTKGVYENQRAESGNKRVFILTRSAFSGQQRYGSVTWSGDIFASWQTFKNQIAAGISFCMSGIPYWTTDIGAFITAFKYPDGVKDDSYKELYVRWFQFGAFCPIFRSHGTNTPREVWQFGDKGSWAYDALVKTDRLRYRLMPYIYSAAWKVTNGNYTMLRGLPMGFPQDKNTFKISNEFMFGPSILVCPVTKEMYNFSKIAGEDIESSYFFTKEGTENGINLDIYRGTDFNKLILSRKFDASQIGWSGCLPASLDTSYSLKMEGKLLSDSEGEYIFKLITDGGARLWINDSLLIDDWNNKSKTELFARINLDHNTQYSFRLEHSQPVKNNALLKINWIKPNNCSEETNTSNVYLPAQTNWFDFWTGSRSPGGQIVKAEAPIDRLPLYVPEGSIIPFGPDIQFAEDKKDGPIELRVYPGKNASFTIYEDEGDSYNYEKGRYSTIPIKWNDNKRMLVIGTRHGKFKGMVNERTFNIVIAGSNHGSGIEQTENPDKVIRYKGEKLKITF